jgi:signal transduction histidine kinase
LSQVTQRDLLATLEQLLEIQPADKEQALDRASDIIAAALGADKVDVFLFDPAVATLVAIGTSNTPMGRKQEQIGLDRLPVANGGRTAEVYQTGRPYFTGRLDEDAKEVPGLKDALGIRSKMSIQIQIDGQPRGTLEIVSARPDAFGEPDLRFAVAAARWMGAIIQRAELIASIRDGALQEGQRRAAEDIFAVLAHDLRNLIAPIRGRLGLLRERASREERPADLRDMQLLETAVARLLRLVHSLLDVSRLERGLFALDQRPMDLVQVAREAVNALRTPNVTLVEKYPDRATVNGDPDRLTQAIENLLANAIKHSPRGAPILVEVLRDASAGGAKATVRVVDQGPGVAPELLPHLFRRYATGAGSSGLGLGLYLAHSIATSHGGTLTVESRPGAGATFELTLPALE